MNGSGSMGDGKTQMLAKAARTAARNPHAENLQGKEHSCYEHTGGRE